MPSRPTRYPEILTVQVRGDVARELRRVHERFGPVAPGLTLARLAERAIAVGLSVAIDDLLTAARDLASVATPTDDTTAPALAPQEGPTP